MPYLISSVCHSEHLITIVYYQLTLATKLMSFLIIRQLMNVLNDYYSKL